MADTEEICLTPPDQLESLDTLENGNGQDTEMNEIGETDGSAVAAAGAEDPVSNLATCLFPPLSMLISFPNLIFPFSTE